MPTATAPNGQVLTLEIAADARARQLGMMGRSEAPLGTGMLFRFEQPGRHSFWMFNCLIPLDIIWLEQDGTVVHVGERLPPCSGPAETCPQYEPPRPASLVLEIQAGSARALGIVPGARLLLDLHDRNPR